MKKLLLIFTLLFSSPSYADWTKVSETENTTYYLDFDNIKKKDGYVYFWKLSNYLKPDEWKDMSNKTLMEADCNIPMKARKIYATYHSQPMGNGEPSTISPKKRDWEHTVPNTAIESMLNIICSPY